jgi:hypothetical protein
LISIGVFPSRLTTSALPEAALAAFFFQASTASPSFAGLAKFIHAFFCSVATPR